MFKSFGSIDCDEYNELESVIDWLLDVINFNLFVNIVDNDNLANWDDTQNVVLPHHVFINKPREFWFGICTILTAMTRNCIQTCLLTADLGHKELLESVLALLDKNSDEEYNIPNFHGQLESYRCKNTVFWPVLQCFVLLVDKLGSRFWMITTTTPNSVLKMIKSNPYYQLQLRICYSEAAKLELTTNTNIDNFSFSQLVYDDSLGKVSKCMEPLQNRYHGFSLSWVVPFIKSLIDFGEYESSTIVELLDFVCHAHTVSLHGDTNVSSTDLFQTVLPIEIIAERVENENLFLPQESLKCITQVVDVLFSQKVYSVLLQCKQAIFCMITVLCSYVLSRCRKHQPASNQIKQHLNQTARTYTSLVMYCSNEKMASELWYLVKQINSLNPFLSIASSLEDSSCSHNDLLQPDELCKTLLKLIADKQNNQDIAGPFLYPPSFNSSASNNSVTVIKQELLEEKTNGRLDCVTEIIPEALVDCDDQELLVYQDQELSSHKGGSNIPKLNCLISTETTIDDTTGQLNQKQVSLKLKKLPITVSKSDKGVLHYTFKTDLDDNSALSSRSISQTLSESVKSHMDSDTESCSSDGIDDDEDDLPSYLPYFTKRRFTDASTSSTVTIEGEVNEQLIVQDTKPREESVKNGQVLSVSTQSKISDENVLETDHSVCITKKVSSTHSLDFSTPKQSSEECCPKVKDYSIKMKGEGNMKNDLTVEQKWCNYNEQNSNCTNIIDMVLLDCDYDSYQPTEDNTVDHILCVPEPDILIEQEGSTGSELGSIENVYNGSRDDDDDDVFSTTDDQTSEFASLNNDVDGNVIKLMQVENEQCNKNCKSFTDKRGDNFVVEDVNVELLQVENEQHANDLVVVPNKYCNLKFRSKTKESDTNVEDSTKVINQTNCDSIKNSTTTNTLSNQLIQNDKIQPAVAGRAPFSKSRMGSLQIPSTPNSVTKVQASKAKDKAISKDLHKRASESVGDSTATTTENTSKVEIKIEPSRVYSKEEFLMEVLSWDPTAFYRSKSVINEGPYSFSSIAKVPLIFESSDQYIDIFKPLLLLETWDTVSLYVVLKMHVIALNTKDY